LRCLRVLFREETALLSVRKFPFPALTRTTARSSASDPISPTLYRNSGNAKLAKGDTNGALADYNQAIKINPKNAVAYEDRGTAKERNGDLDGALTDYGIAEALSKATPAQHRATES
jgi:Flp pilus assembly protein TadD